MVYFEISKLGFNCGYDKSQCKGFPNNCDLCIQNRLNELGFITDRLKIIDLDSQEKQLELARDQIWQKFMDFLNIRSIIFMNKESGISLFNLHITGKEVDANLLSGFIQANIIFSKSEELNTCEKDETRNFYEFQYTDFNILLMEGSLLRFCLILSQPASKNIRVLAQAILFSLETKFRDIIIESLKLGSMKFENDFKDYIIKAFEIELTNPMEIIKNILPRELENINSNRIQKAIYDFANKTISEKGYLIIVDIIDKINNLVNVDSKIILYEIYQLVQKGIFIPRSIEETQDKLKVLQEMEEKKIAETKIISSLISTKNVYSDIKAQLDGMNQESARKIMDSFLKKAETAERSSIYQEAKREYEKALFVAQQLQLSNEIGRISYLIIEMEKRNKHIELEYAIEAGEKAEKSKDYFKAIENFQKAITIIENYFGRDNNGEQKQMKKLAVKIEKLQESLKI
jgi:tetratricopeptide (TPR) repeat protein